MARKTTIEQAAKEQSVSVGEADLRRMKRQFSSLKNTFLHYEVKDEFIAALADGLPNGTEDIQLQQFEEEAERNIELLREWKSKNVSKQDEIRNLIETVDGVMAEVDGETKKTLEDLHVLFDEMAEFEAFERDAAIDIEPGMDEEECRRIIQEESRRALELESRLIASMDELHVLESKAPDMRHELEMMKEELSGVQSAVAAAHAEKENREATDASASKTVNRKSTSRQHYARAKTSAWASESISVLQAISGVSDVNMIDTTVTLTNTTMFPVHSMVKSRSNEAIMASSTEHVDHQIELQMDETTGHVITGTIVPSPPCYSSIIDDIVTYTLAQNRYPTVERVLGDVRIRLAGYHHRKALIEGEAAAGMKAIHDVSNDANDFTCVTKGGLRLKIHIKACWPEHEDQFTIVSCEPSMPHGDTECSVEHLTSQTFDGFASLLTAVDETSV